MFMGLVLDTPEGGLHHLLIRCFAGLRIVLDFVPNHTSNESMWFQESRKGPNNRYSNYYIWQDGVMLPNGSRAPPNNWVSAIGEISDNLCKSIFANQSS